HYLVLDACRNTLQGARGGKGFLPVGQQSGVLVAFAAEPGKTASDTGMVSGPYAAALATELVKPGQSDLIMFHNVRVAVMEMRAPMAPIRRAFSASASLLRFSGGVEAAAVLAPSRFCHSAGRSWRSRTRAASFGSPFAITALEFVHEAEVAERLSH